jgi:hypothetical protein
MYSFDRAIPPETPWTPGDWADGRRLFEENGKLSIAFTEISDLDQEYLQKLLLRLTGHVQEEPSVVDCPRILGQKRSSKHLHSCLRLKVSSHWTNSMFTIRQFTK